MTLGTFLITLGGVSASLSLVMSTAWIVQQRTGNSGWVDAVWTFGLGVVGLVVALLPVATMSGPTGRQTVVAVLVIAWSTRLGLHIARRSAGISDDPRYAKLIRGWGADAPRKMFWLLQKQALVSIPLAMSIYLAAQNPLPGLRVQDGLGVALFILGLIGESLADYQLRWFKANTHGRKSVNTAGLWSWSRHPNYFFEWVMWLAYAVIAVDVTGAYAWGFAALMGPICIYWLLVHVSGIPPLEEHMLETRGEAFRAYQARTNAFFPAPPRPHRDWRRNVPRAS